MPRFRRGASSTPRPRNSSADVPGILDGPVKPDDEERRGITAPRARFCGSGRSGAACGTTCRPHRRETSAQFRSCWATRRSRRRRFIPASTWSGNQVRAGRRGPTRHCAARSSDRHDKAQMTLRLIFLDAGTGQAILIGQSIEQDGHNSAFAPPCVLQRLRAHPDVFGGVGDRGVAHQLAQSPGIHAAIGLHRAGSMPEAVRMHRPGDPRVLPAVAIILLMANREKAWPRSLVKMCGRLGSCSRCSRLRPMASSRSR